MRRIPSLTILLLLIIFAIAVLLSKLQSSLKGAWHFKEGDDESLMICNFDWLRRRRVDYNQVRHCIFTSLQAATIGRSTGTLITFPAGLRAPRMNTNLLDWQRAFKYTLAYRQQGDHIRRWYQQKDVHATRWWTRSTSSGVAIKEAGITTTTGKTESLNATQKTMKIVSGFAISLCQFQHRNQKDFISLLWWQIQSLRTANTWKRYRVL